MKIYKTIINIGFGIVASLSFGLLIPIPAVDESVQLIEDMRAIFSELNENELDIDSYDIGNALGMITHHRETRESLSPETSSTLVITDPNSGDEIVFYQELFSDYATALWVLNQKQSKGDRIASEFIATLKESYLRHQLEPILHLRPELQTNIPRSRFPLVDTILPLTMELEAAIACFINLETQDNGNQDTSKSYNTL